MLLVVGSQIQKIAFRPFVSTNKTVPPERSRVAFRLVKTDIVIFIDGFRDSQAIASSGEATLELSSVQILNGFLFQVAPSKQRIAIE